MDRADVYYWDDSWIFHVKQSLPPLHSAHHTLWKVMHSIQLWTKFLTLHLTQYMTNWFMKTTKNVLWAIAVA